MSQILIEARQLNSNQVFNNGDFQFTLEQPLEIEEGDVINVKNCFLDTRNLNKEGTINLNEDQNVSISTIMYNSDWKQELATLSNGAPNVNFRTFEVSNTTDHPTGADYILCEPIGSAQEVQKLTAIIMYVSTEMKGPDQYRGLDYKWRYTKPDGTISFFDIPISKKEAEHQNKEVRGKYKLVKYTLKTPIIMLPDSLNLDSPTTAESKDKQGFLWLVGGYASLVRPTDPPNSTELTNITLTSGYKPKEFTTNFTIPSGNYSPSDLADRVSRELSITKNGIVDIKNNGFLTKAGFYDSGNAYVFIKEDGTDYYTVTNDNQYWLGSNELALKYDIDLQKFKWSFIHFPFYDTKDKSGDIVNKVIQLANGQDKIQGKAGGVLITSWSKDFFNDVLGFDNTVLCNPDSYVNLTNKGAQTFQVPKWTITDGENTTTNFTGLDSIVDKTTNNWYYLETTIAGIESTTNATTPIIASNVVQPDTTIPFSHYIVEVDCGFKNDYITKDHNRKSISAIVNKYYSADNYTIYQDQPVPYVHKGKQQTLTSVKIRVVDPNFNKAELGEDNTIIISVQKNKKY